MSKIGRPTLLCRYSEPLISGAAVTTQVASVSPYPSTTSALGNARRSAASVTLSIGAAPEDTTHTLSVLRTVASG